jgi:hypothetical protein
MALYTSALGFDYDICHGSSGRTMMNYTVYTSGPCQFPISLRYHLGLVILLPALFIVGMNPSYRRLWCPARFAISDPRIGSVSLHPDPNPALAAPPKIL